MLNNDAGSTSVSYTDSTVAAETSYVFAIKARNSDGLSLESDPVSTTTPAASEETPAAEQIARASFTLDGQALDTSGTCSDDDIAAVTDDCTIDITTRSPVFAVHGTVDSDDRIGIRTGRDLAAALAATEVAGESELRGEDQTVTLALPEGRSLLRLWDDEDGESGGEQASFFRINVLPYWELNGEQLSKDSACQSTSDRALADVTDSDCIVTQSENSGSIRFHNVTREHFNVYVSVNGSETIQEPDDDALGGPFTITLQGGDNLLRVRLASKGNTHGAESYGSNAFYYKITTPSPPAKPTGISYGASHDNVLMFWTDPGDDSITGYQILRGLAADTLAVLTDDTGSASASYSDDTVEPETEYFYAIRARNAVGLGPQSDTGSVTTQAAPEEFLTELAVAGAEFTLNGETLDTTGTCSESDIESIVAGCTFNILDGTVPLALDGTLSLRPGRAVIFQIARTFAEIVAAHQVATQADFPNDGDSKDITFPAGKNFFRVLDTEGLQARKCPRRCRGLLSCSRLGGGPVLLRGVGGAGVALRVPEPGPRRRCGLAVLRCGIGLVRPG